MQWGTTGPAILIAYLTPLKGLACHSGSYVLYGSAATSAWFLLTISCFLSHAAMLRDQTTRKVDQLESTRTIGHSVLCGFAVCTRYLGKTIAVVNAGWLVSFALLEYIGVLQTCWCEANILSMGSRGWAPVFQDALNLTPASNLTFWGGGLAFSLLVCAVGMTFFWLASGGAELDDV
jgi:hypothetical protein